jgi:DNA-binding CsgD family transcriptional regulator
VSTHDLPRLREIHSVFAQSIDQHSFLKALVHTVFAEHGGRAALLAVLGADDTVFIAESYGYDDEAIQKGSSYSLWSTSATNDSMRSGEILVFTSREDYLAAYPSNKGLVLPSGGLITIPIWVKGFPVGVLGLVCERDTHDGSIEPLLEIAQCVRLVMEITSDHPIWMDSQSNSWDAFSRSVSNGASDYSSQLESAIPGSAELTQRELMVLRGLENDMTNRQIASHLHLSESTIGKTTIAIYEKLRAKNRRDAVRIALRLGILKQELVSEEQTLASEV